MELSQAIETDAGEIKEIDLTQPTVADISEIGIPFRVGVADGDVTLSPKVCRRYICRLGHIPMSVVDKLTPADFMELSWAVVGFFGESRKTPAK